MKKLLLGAVLMLLAAAGAVGWKFGLPLLQADAAQAHDGAPVRVESRFVPLPALAVPVLRNGALVEQFELSIQIEVAGPAGEKRTEERMPLLTDALVTELYGVVALRHVLQREDGVEILRERLAAAAGRVLGDDVLRQVLLTSINRRPGAQVRSQRG